MQESITKFPDPKKDMQQESNPNEPVTSSEGIKQKTTNIRKQKNACWNAVVLAVIALSHVVHTLSITYEPSRLPLLEKEQKIVAVVCLMAVVAAWVHGRNSSEQLASCYQMHSVFITVDFVSLQSLRHATRRPSRCSPPFGLSKVLSRLCRCPQMSSKRLRRVTAAHSYAGIPMILFESHTRLL